MKIKNQRSLSKMPDYDEHTPLSASANHSYWPNYTAESTENATATTTFTSNKEVEVPMSSSPKVHFSWHNISVQLPSDKIRLWKRFTQRNKTDTVKSSRKNILTNVTGVAYPGELLAILGASGAGKTTLLNVLTMRHRGKLKVEGQVYVNGRVVSSNLLTTISAYVQQDDLFLGTLTVREHLIFQALLRMDKNTKYVQRIRRVNEVIAELGLFKCQDTLIGVPGRVKGISGGEKRRLAFASEVLTNPPILFCDEPTSGLDSFMAQSVVTIMRSMAAKGKTVICTIHQPSSDLYALFDKILLLSEGRVAYLGDRNGALRFFESLGLTCPANYNPADFFIHSLAVIPGRELQQKYFISLICDAFDDSELGEEIEREASGQVPLDLQAVEEHPESWKKKYKASCFQQTRAVMWRSALSVFREPLIIKMRFIQTFIVAVLFAVIYWGQDITQAGVTNINGVLFLLLINVSFQNLFAVMTVFCSELPIFIREHSNGMYRTFIYFICKTSAELPVFILIPLILTCITYWSIGLYPDWRNFLTACIILIFVTIAAVSFGYLVSAVSNSATMALSVGPPCLLPFMLFGGFFLNEKTIPWYFSWLKYISWFRYGFEALCINQWTDIHNIKCDILNSTCPGDGSVVLHTLGFTPSNFTFDILMLLVCIVFLRIMTFIALVFKARKRR